MPEKNAVAVQMLVTEQLTEYVRCTRLATGQVVYEFWSDGRRIGRIDANAYELALETARDNVQDEETPEHVEFTTSKAFRPKAAPDA